MEYIAVTSEMSTTIAMIYEERASIYNMPPRKNRGVVNEVIIGDTEAPASKTAPRRLIYSIAFLFLKE